MKIVGFRDDRGVVPVNQIYDDPAAPEGTPPRRINNQKSEINHLTHRALKKPDEKDPQNQYPHEFPG